MNTKARLIKALIDNNLLDSKDMIKSAKMSSEELAHLNGEVLVLVNRKRKKKDGRDTPSQSTVSHFTFSDGKNSFLFVSKNADRVGAIADFIIDFLPSIQENVKEDKPC